MGGCDRPAFEGFLKNELPFGKVYSPKRASSSGLVLINLDDRVEHLQGFCARALEGVAADNRA